MGNFIARPFGQYPSDSSTSTNNSSNDDSPVKITSVEVNADEIGENKEQTQEQGQSRRRSRLIPPRTYDLHITVANDTNIEDLEEVVKSFNWKIHDIRNVQGTTADGSYRHIIVSQKYTGYHPLTEMNRMAREIANNGENVIRKKVELHFNGYESDVPSMYKNSPDNEIPGIIEVHYKCKKRGIFRFSENAIDYLNQQKLALSFNARTSRPIISQRYDSLDTFVMKGISPDISLPKYLEEVEREVVIFDSNNSLDSFWPMCDMAETIFPKENSKPSYEFLPEFIMKNDF